MHITIRKALASDMEVVPGLVKTLAAFEQMPEHVEMTAGDYLQHGFEDMRFEVLLAEDTTTVPSVIAGMAFYFPAYSTWRGPYYWLEDLVVTAEYRNRGIGEQLIQALIDVSRSKGYRFLKWQVLDWNEDAMRFYRRLGATMDNEWTTWRLDPID